MDAFSISDIPEHLLQEIITKMPIKDTVKMQQTCSSMKSFIEKRSKMLESRVSMGVSPIVMPIEGILHIYSGNSKIKLTEGFHEKFVGIPIKDLHVETRSVTPSQIREIIKALEAWNPVCYSLSTDPRLSDEDFFEILRHVRCLGPLNIKILEAKDVPNKVEKLHTIGNPGCVQLGIYEPYDSMKLFEQMKPFGQISAKIGGNTAIRFLHDLATSSDPGNFVEARLALITAMEKHFDFPHETLLQVSGKYRRKHPATFGVYLLRLKNNKLAIVGHRVNEKLGGFDSMNLHVIVIPNNNNWRLVSAIQTCLLLHLQDEEKEKIVESPMEKKLEMIRVAWEATQQAFLEGYY